MARPNRLPKGNSSACQFVITCSSREGSRILSMTISITSRARLMTCGISGWCRESFRSRRISKPNKPARPLEKGAGFSFARTLSGRSAARKETTNSDNSQEDFYGHECDLLCSYGTHARQDCGKPLDPASLRYRRNDPHIQLSICLHAFYSRNETVISRSSLRENSRSVLGFHSVRNMAHAGGRILCG